MRNTDYFKQKRITIVGLARSGLACANLLYGLGADVSVSDTQDNELTRLNALRLKSKEIKIELGRHSQEFFKGRDLIVVSPGVNNTSAAVLWAEGFKIPVLAEIEIAWILCPGIVVAVTGSNGKTTTTTLIGKILEAQGKNVFICGNIGNPFSQEVERIGKSDYVSLEVSSFQLERIESFKPKISLILNFNCNHLDRYNNLQEYLEAKKRIFMNQDNCDFLVLNYDDPMLRDLAKTSKAKVVFFKEGQGLNHNQAAVLAIANLLGVKQDLCLKVFREFKGLEHRLEEVVRINNIRFINDSKATTAESTVWALKNIPEPVILIAGGRDKGVDYSVILGVARQRLKAVILIGEAKERLKTMLADSFSVDEADTLDEAVIKAYRKAKSGDCVLLSPMCSSFDMFLNYEERGKAFKKAVLALVS